MGFIGVIGARVIWSLPTIVLFILFAVLFVSIFLVLWFVLTKLLPTKESTISLINPELIDKDEPRTLLIQELNDAKESFAALVRSQDSNGLYFLYLKIILRFLWSEFKYELSAKRIKSA
jgi:hypothetical protein